MNREMRDDECDTQQRLSILSLAQGSYLRIKIWMLSWYYYQQRTKICSHGSGPMSKTAPVGDWLLWYSHMLSCNFNRKSYKIIILPKIPTTGHRHTIIFFLLSLCVCLLKTLSLGSHQNNHKNDRYYKHQANNNHLPLACQSNLIIIFQTPAVLVLNPWFPS